MANLIHSPEDQLKEFHEKYGHLISEVPTLDIPSTVKDLRQKLICEEINETFEGMGYFKSSLMSPPQLYPDKQDLVEIADGIADAIYVLIGTAVSYGIPIMRIFNEVHNSNMTKTAVKAVDGQKYGTKTPKGPDYVPPDIKGILQFPQDLTELEMRNL